MSHFGFTEEELDHYQIIDHICQKYNLLKEHITWNGSYYKLPDYNDPNFDLFPDIPKALCHVKLRPKQHYEIGVSTSWKKKHRKDILDRYLVLENNANRNSILHVGHLIASSLSTYADNDQPHYNKEASVVPETAWCNSSGEGQNYFEDLIENFIKQNSNFDYIEYKVIPIYIDADPKHNLPIMIAMQAKINAEDQNLKFPKIDSSSFSVLIPNLERSPYTLDYGFVKL